MTTKRVLFLAAEPLDEVRLRLGQEQREIRNVLRLSAARDSIELFDRFAIRPADFTQALHDVRPHVVHFSGHGSRSGNVYFENDTGISQPADPDALASLFQLVSGEVEAVVLNACYSETQALAIARSIEHVIGMQNLIMDDAAIRFSAGFYKALGAERNYLESFNFGVAEMRLHGLPDYLTPVLHMKRVLGPAHMRTDQEVPRGVYARFYITGGRFDSPGQGPSSYIYVDPSQFESLRSLIETLYTHYLADEVSPFTYGKDWIIAGGIPNRHVLLAPPEWIKMPSAPTSVADPSWGNTLRLEDVAITSGTLWTIRRRGDLIKPLVMEPFAVASSDTSIVAVLRRHPKGFLVLQERFADATTARDMGRNPSHSIVVMEDWTSSGFGGRWFVDKGGDIPEHAQFYFDPARP